MCMYGGLLSAMDHPGMPFRKWECTQASCCLCPLATQLFGEISGLTNLSNRQMAKSLELIQFMASTAIGCTVEALTVGALQRYWRRAGLTAHPVLPTATPLMRRL